MLGPSDVTTAVEELNKTHFTNGPASSFLLEEVGPFCVAMFESQGLVFFGKCLMKQGFDGIFVDVHTNG